MCDESYTVGPHMYQRTRRPEIGTKTRLSLVSEFIMRKGYAAASSSSPVAEGGATQFARIAASDALSPWRDAEQPEELGPSAEAMLLKLRTALLSKNSRRRVC